MKVGNFLDIKGNSLLVKSRRSAVILSLSKDVSSKSYDFDLEFTKDIFKELIEYIEEISQISWKGLKPKGADSLGSDYFEYYDRVFDNNGYLTIGENKLIVQRPSLDSPKLYQFNKRKMQSFLYDIAEIG